MCRGSAVKRYGEGTEDQLLQVVARPYWRDSAKKFRQRVKQSRDVHHRHIDKIYERDGRLARDARPNKQTDSAKGKRTENIDCRDFDALCKGQWQMAKQ